MEKDKYRKDLFIQLDTLFSNVSSLKYLSQILDNAWRDTIQGEINNSDLEPVFISNKANIFFELSAWSGGIDLIEKRLQAYFESEFNPQLLEDKLNSLIKNRFSLSFFNYLFEIQALGAFAIHGMLDDIEIPIGTQGSSIDGLIKSHNRPIYAEVTLTSQEILSSLPGSHVASIDELYDQVLKKIRKKVTESIQIALVNDSPSLLIIGRNPRGADRIMSEIVIKDCFDNSKFMKLSGIIVSDSWKFLCTKFYEGINPEIKLSSKETEQIKAVCSTSNLNHMRH